MKQKDREAIAKLYMEGLDRSQTIENETIQQNNSELPEKDKEKNNINLIEDD